MQRRALRLITLLGLLVGPVALSFPGGTGRLTLSPAWRLTPNTLFEGYARDAGAPLFKPSPGGPGLFATGGYAITAELEVEISLFAGAERLQLAATPDIYSVTYGAMVGLRAGYAFWEDRIRPSLFVGTGPALVVATGGNLEKFIEKLSQVWVFGAGVSINVAPHWDLNFDYRLLIGSRGTVTNIGSLNGGGSWFSIGVSYLFAPEPGYSSKPAVPEYEGTGMQSF